MKLRSERDVIRAILKRAVSSGVASSEDFPLYDDVYAFKFGETYIILKIDGFSSWNVLLPWNTLQDFGWKAVTACLSDVYVKGGMPRYVLVSVGAETAENAYKIMEGVVDAAAFYGVQIAGGDTNSSRGESWIDVAALGFSSRPLTRFNARMNDLIVVTGYFGSTGAAFQALAKGVKPERVGVVDCLYKATSRPKAVNKFPELIRSLGECITASIDVSDGLADSLYQLSEACGHTVKLEDVPPLNDCTRSFIEEHNLDMLSAIFYGGEEYEAVFTVNPNCRDLLEELCEETLGRPCTIVGTMGPRGKGVFYGSRRLKPGGWDHFTSAVPI